MKIAFLGIKGLPSKGGAERVVEAIVGRMGGEHELTVYCNKRYTPEEAKVPGVKLIRIPTLTGKYLQPVSLLVFSTFHALFRGDYDIVHVHNMEACFVLPLLLIKYKVIATAHGQPYKVDKWGRLAKMLMHLTEYFYIFLPHVRTSVSHPFAQYCEKKYKKKVLYIPNGVDVLSPNQPDKLKKLEKREKRDYILFSAGRIIPSKGCHLLLRAFSDLKTDMKLMVVGDVATERGYGRELQQLADERVKFIPFIESKTDLQSLIQSALLFVFPSTLEAMSMMLLEVAALGVPIVCSDIPENTEVLGEHALYFKSGDVTDLTNKLRWALEHMDSMGEKSHAAKVYVKENYLWEKIIQEYEQNYQKALAA